MKGKRFKEEQIIRILHEAEHGLTVVDEFTRQGFDIHVGRSRSCYIRQAPRQVISATA